MDVIRLAHTFGESIKETPELVAYFRAKTAYDADADLARLLFEYEAQRRVLAREFEQDAAEQHPDLIAAVRDRLSALAAQIADDPAYRDYEAAKRRVNELMQRINGEISATVFGVIPAACTHDCSTCAGCASRAAEESDTDGADA